MDEAKRTDPPPREPRRRVLRHPLLAALAVLAVALALLAWFWDWNWFKGPVERQVEARTGRRFEIGGDLDVRLGRTVVIRMDQVRFGNASWSRHVDMASAERVAFGIRIWPLLLHRELRVPSLALRSPRLLLEKNAKGAGNWDFGRAGGSEAQFRDLRVDDGRLRFLDPAGHTDIQVDVASEPRRGTGPAAVAVRGGGTWQGNEFTIEGRAESPLALRDRDAPYRIDAHARAGATRAHARGTLLDPLRLRDFDLQLALAGRDLSDLYPLLGIATPDTGPYTLDGRLTRERRGAATVWHYDRFKGRVGDSDLAGDASVATGGNRPTLRADLVSRHLDFDDLAGFVGAAPQSGGGESSNPKLAARGARQRASGKLLPDTPYELDKLNAMDADVRLKARRIEAPGLPLDDMDAHLLLEGGVLTLKPLDFGVAGGHVRSDLRMDARESPIRTRADVDAGGLDLGRLLPDAKLAKDAAGHVGGRIALSGTGNSVAAMLGSSDGSVAIGMGKGQVSNLLLEYAGLDVQEALKFLVEGDREIPIRCAFGDFGVKDGLMTSKALAFDTTDTIIVGSGTVSLKSETLDLVLRPRPKDRSLLVFRSPLLLEGSFRQPRFHPDLKRVGLRAAIALVLGNIAPPAALLATLELGPGEDAQCGGHYAR